MLPSCPPWRSFSPLSAPSAPAASGLVRYWLRLRFLRRAFERNGDRKDLAVAGKVTAPGWTVRGERRGSSDVRRE